MFSKACKYAIKALVYLASRTGEGRKIGLTEIADAIDSPMHFTAKIMQILSKQGIVSSAKGPNGGFYIDKSAPDIYLIQVVSAIDGVAHLSGCGLGLKGCSAEHPCPIHEDFSEVRDKLNQLLREQTIQQLAAEMSNGKSYLKTVIMK
jgi:Rrf2 family transcriptional regulator, iron-sulfur cluster assembly transcription factor